MSDRSPSFSVHRRRNWAVVSAFLVVLAAGPYVVRRTLMLGAARTALNHDSALVAQERADGVTIIFAEPPAPWISPMKNQMNDIWRPVNASGVNYYMFGGPRTWFTTYSERSNPTSPYYQAWVGAYVIKLTDGTLPADLQALAWQVTSLDQRSWLSAMGDPKPIADASPASIVGHVTIDDHVLPLWHGMMQSHSDLSAHPGGLLPRLIGMPPRAAWPAGLASFHEVTLDGYFTCWVDAPRRVSVVVYGVAANYPGQTEARPHNRDVINDELLSLMKSAKLETLR